VTYRFLSEYEYSKLLYAQNAERSEKNLHTFFQIKKNTVHILL